MSNINEICCNPRLHDLVLAGWPPCCARRRRVVGRTRPWSMPLAILTIRKELHRLPFLCIRVVPFSIIMGLPLAALRAAGAPPIIIPWARVGHEMVDSQRSTQGRVSYNQSHIQQARMEYNCFVKLVALVYWEIMAKFYCILITTATGKSHNL